MYCVTQVCFRLVLSQDASHTHSLAICSSSPHAFISLSFCFQSAAKLIKESMDKKFGSSWHVVIGEGFGFEVSHEVRNLLYMFFGGSLAVCVWKCSWCRFLPTQSPLWDIYTRGSVLTMQPYLTWDVCVWVWRGGGTDSCALLQITLYLSYVLKASILRRKHRF